MHAPKWRARYGTEFEALLMDLPASPANLADVAGSILVSRKSSLAFGLSLIAAVLMTLFGFAKLAAPTGYTLSKHTGASVACLRYTGHLHRVRPHCSVG
jgi:hypothetical protein